MNKIIKNKYIFFLTMLIFIIKDNYNIFGFWQKNKYEPQFIKSFNELKNQDNFTKNFNDEEKKLINETNINKINYRYSIIEKYKCFFHQDNCTADCFYSDKQTKFYLNFDNYTKQNFLKMLNIKNYNNEQENIVNDQNRQLFKKFIENLNAYHDEEKEIYDKNTKYMFTLSFILFGWASYRSF